MGITGSFPVSPAAIGPGESVRPGPLDVLIKLGAQIEALAKQLEGVPAFINEAVERALDAEEQLAAIHKLLGTNLRVLTPQIAERRRARLAAVPTPDPIIHIDEPLPAPAPANDAAAVIAAAPKIISKKEIQLTADAALMMLTGRTTFGEQFSDGRGGDRL